MEFIELKTDIREGSGKGFSKSLRREEKIPGILYGPGADPVMLSINKKDLETSYKQTTTTQVFVNLLSDSPDLNKRTAMVKELQIDPLTFEYKHIDLLEVDKDKKIGVMVPVTITGLSVGVDLGGLIQIIRRELEIICRPKDVPEKIEIDVTDLDIGDSVHVDDISLEGDIEIPHDVNFTVITVLQPKGAAEEEGEELEGEELEGEELEGEESESGEEKSSEGNE